MGCMDFISSITTDFYIYHRIFHVKQVNTFLGVSIKLIELSGDVSLNVYEESHMVVGRIG